MQHLEYYLTLAGLVGFVYLAYPRPTRSSVTKPTPEPVQETPPTRGEIIQAQFEVEPTSVVISWARFQQLYSEQFPEAESLEPVPEYVPFQWGADWEYFGVRYGVKPEKYFGY